MEECGEVAVWRHLEQQEQVTKHIWSKKQMFFAALDPNWGLLLEVPGAGKSEESVETKWLFGIYMSKYYN